MPAIEQRLVGRTPRTQSTLVSMLRTSVPKVTKQRQEQSHTATAGAERRPRSPTTKALKKGANVKSAPGPAFYPEIQVIIPTSNAETISIASSSDMYRVEGGSRDHAMEITSDDDATLVNSSYNRRTNTVNLDTMSEDDEIEYLPKGQVTERQMQSLDNPFNLGDDGSDDNLPPISNLLSQAAKQKQTNLVSQKPLGKSAVEGESSRTGGRTEAERAEALRRILENGSKLTDAVASPVKRPPVVISSAEEEDEAPITRPPLTPTSKKRRLAKVRMITGASNLQNFIVSDEDDDDSEDMPTTLGSGRSRKKNVKHDYRGLQKVTPLKDRSGRPKPPIAFAADYSERYDKDLRPSPYMTDDDIVDMMEASKRGSVEPRRRRDDGLARKLLKRKKPRDEKLDEDDLALIARNKKTKVLDRQRRHKDKSTLAKRRKQRQLENVKRKREGKVLLPSIASDESDSALDRAEFDTDSNASAPSDADFIVEDDGMVEAEVFEELQKNNTAPTFPAAIKTIAKVILYRILDPTVDLKTIPSKYHIPAALRTVDGKVDTVAGSLVSSSRWKSRFDQALRKHPKRNLFEMDDDGYEPEDQCDACNYKRKITNAISFYGKDYNRKTGGELSEDEDSDAEKESESDISSDNDSLDGNGNKRPHIFKVSKGCYNRAVAAHELLHWRYILRKLVLDWLKENVPVFKGYGPKKIRTRIDRMNLKDQDRIVIDVEKQFRNEGLYEEVVDRLENMIKEAEKKQMNR